MNPRGRDSREAVAKSGVVVLDKPAGPTSHDVVDRVRRILGCRRAGHAGTLDPFATGVLTVCFGGATRLTSYLSDLPKRYSATVCFGFSTDTDDVTGAPLGPQRSAAVEIEALRRELESHLGEIDQVVPAYSAKRVGGRRLHEIARAGATVELPRTRVTVDSIDIVEFRGESVVLDIACSSGTYIRAIARDLGAALGVGAHLATLRRTEASGFTLADAVSLEELERRLDGASVEPGRVLRGLPAVSVVAEEFASISHGRPIERGRDEVVSGSTVRLMSPGGEIAALAEARESAKSGRVALWPRVVLTGS